MFLFLLCEAAKLRSTPINYPTSLDNFNTSSILDVVKQEGKDPFYNIIPSIYVYNKHKPISIYFDIFDVSTTKFIAEILSKLVFGSTYTVFIRIKYNINEYFMAGNQFGFVYSCKTNVNELQLVVRDRLEELLDEYNISAQDVRYVMISFRQKDQKLLSEFSIDKKHHISTPDFKLAENKLTVPVSVNEESLGIPLRVVTSNGFITYIKLNTKGVEIKFLDVIKSKAKILRAGHKDNITIFNDNFKFYLLKDNTDFILAINKLSDKFIDKIRYSLNGVLMSHVSDSINDNVIIRTSGETRITLNKYNNKI